MNDHQLLPVGAGRAYTVDFTNDLPQGVTLSTVVFTISPSEGMTLSAQSNDYPNGKSTIKVEGAQHDIAYVLQALGTYSNGETYPKDISLLGFNG